MPKIKKFNQHIELHADKWFHPALTCTPLIPGELYLFHRSDAGCPAEGSLWGVYDKRVKGRVYLESGTEDMVRFCKWIRLPDGYRYCRLSTRAELRDYISRLLWAESRICDNGV